ncbi:DNA primase [Gordonia phage Nimi13]|uniref:DNA primase n=1 Tax=Gordonia phage Nimi13 TaxID=2517933 RepID=A0A482JDQ3_9CAUD|nr:DNA primase [Gordonia phage Nimi13]UVF60780.1 DNA primase [Gordonia phage Sticker17]UVK60244.1 DNA primase [Gordonia phage Shelley]UVK61712.1 DNA primase [Gordonia phage MrWormie]
MPEVNATDAALAKLLAKRFVQRKDVKAVQVADGGYRPVREPWKMGDFISHVTGEQTFGHYTCDENGLTKLVVFDIDLDTGYCSLKKNGQPLPECCEVGHGTWVELPADDRLAEITADSEFYEAITVHPCHPRDDWHDRRHPSRPWLKYQLRSMCDFITSGIQNHMQLQSVAAYSGNKGCHVYAFFPEPIDARVARQAALLTLEYAGKLISPNAGFEPVHGSNFFKHAETDPYYNYQNLTVEIFPKQASMKNKELGNLCRLPLGKNLKHVKDPTFLIDQRLAPNELKPHPDPVTLLESGNPFAS